MDEDDSADDLSDNDLYIVLQMIMPYIEVVTAVMNRFMILIILKGQQQINLNFK
jgi:hypothetical protein